MSNSGQDVTERSRLLPASLDRQVESVISSHANRDGQVLGGAAVGERLPYNEYTTIDWLNDLVKDSYRARAVHTKTGLRSRCLKAFDSCQGWIIAGIIGVLTASVAATVDIAVVTVSDWKFGYCKTNPLTNREACCPDMPLMVSYSVATDDTCAEWHYWAHGYWKSYAIYVAWALLFGIISGSVTMTTKASLPVAKSSYKDQSDQRTGKVMYLAAGSGIPEIKTILSGFVIPHYLDLKVLVVKAVGSTFAVPTGMNLGKEGPFVHISTCVSYLVAINFPKYRDNTGKLREMLTAGCASGLSVAFGAPIGGVLFTYEEISTFFPRKVLWRAFISSLSAAIILRALNPTGTGRLVLFETSYRTTYEAVHYLIFVILGLAGGVFGGLFCKANFLWSRNFRAIRVIKDNPVFEIFLVVLATALLQYPNPLTRLTGDISIKHLLVDCSKGSKADFVCQNEHMDGSRLRYIGYLIYGVLVKLVLTTITFGAKVPSGVIIPALNAGAFFGRLMGQIPVLASTIPPGTFAMVGAAAFLAGVSRMTISLAVIMFELTGELEFVVPNMIGIMIAKWVADAIEEEGVYSLAQIVLGHPFLDLDSAVKKLQRSKVNYAASDLAPPKHIMQEIIVEVDHTGCVERSILAHKLEQLKERGLMDGGLVLVSASDTGHNGACIGYLPECELDHGLQKFGARDIQNSKVRLIPLGDKMSLSRRGPDNLASDRLFELDLCSSVDRTPLIVTQASPVEYVIEIFGKLGPAYLIIMEEGSGCVTGVIVKKRLIAWLETLKHS